MKTGHLTLIICLSLFVVSCARDHLEIMGDGLDHLPYNPSEYSLDIPQEYLNLPINELDDKELTLEGITLGQHLFYDPILSIDGSVSCASCHKIERAFSDKTVVPEGVGGAKGNRSSMSLLNLHFSNTGLFWDGRVNSLSEQAEMPIQNELEMNNTVQNVEEKLREHIFYPELFRKAFGIKSKDEISFLLVTKAIAQFETIMISGGNSKYDRYLKGQYELTEEESRGFELFFNKSDHANSPDVNNPNIPITNCSNCHTPPLFTSLQYLNNGLDSLHLLTDPGRSLVTRQDTDVGRFKTTSLRDIELSAPYMHDGRFATLMEVIEHYNSGGVQTMTTDVNIKPLGLTETQKEHLISFLRMLTDTSYRQNPLLQDPFARIEK